MRHFKRPHTATIVAFAALLVALGGTALAATGTIVNIADPSDAAKVAHVDAAGKLFVGDGSGALSVDGTVTAQSAAANAFWRFGNSGTGTACRVIATPPTGKAAILKTLSVN